jgi:diguanylate cyclase (GGDEF)-like protein/PAS domain S-box-containing protein
MVREGRRAARRRQQPPRCPMNTRTSRTQLLALVWPFVAVVLIQTAIAVTSVYTLSAVRAYVAGESLWSKGQRNAILSLERYVHTGRERHFSSFEAAIAVPLADLDGRIALESTPPDRAAAAQGYLLAGNHPNDVPAMIWLFVNFHPLPYLREAIVHWHASDAPILALRELGDEIRARRIDGFPRAAEVTMWQARIDELDARITPLTIAFQEALGRGSRAIAQILLTANLLTGALLILLAAWRTGNLLRQKTRADLALSAERERAQTTLTSIGQAVVTACRDGRIDYMNPFAEKLLGWTAADAVGQPLCDVLKVTAVRSAEIDDGLATRMTEGESLSTGTEPRSLMRRGGQLAPVALSSSPVIVDGKRAGTVVVLNDMARERAFIDQLAWQATHDDLTSLMNRRGFEKAIEDFTAKPDAPAAALLCLDLDQFKIINDTCGHAAGDELLRQVADVFRQRLKGSDVLARLGGDEFGLILDDCSLDDAARIAEAIRAAIEAHAFTWQERPFTITASIGLVSLRGGQDWLEVLRTADLACYLAKEKGRNRIQVHAGSDTELEERAGQMAWVQRIHSALEDDRFVLYQQPIVALDPKARGRHCEILLRLRDEKGDLVSPAFFIPPAERYGLMPLIDRWVVRKTLAALAQGVEGERIDTCAINLSGQTFGDANFVDFMKSQFMESGVDPRTVCFEVTETSAIADIDTARCFIGAMKRLGCRFSLDDFGSGMSSFAYLKHLPVDYLKIDGSFVRDMLEDRVDRAMVEMIHHIGKVTGKLTVAECVECEETVALLRTIGVGYAQGYAFAAPAPLRTVDPTSRATDRRPAEETPFRLTA